jgi:5-methylthioadenosine/S-adenosylhomocysteine deaminase
VTAEQAVEMATINGARALRWDDVTGSLEAGKEADITCFSTEDFDWRPLHNPVANLVYGSTGHSVHTVLVAGEILLDAKRLTRVDEAEVREAVERIDRDVLGRIGVSPSPAWPVL